MQARSEPPFLLDAASLKESADLYFRLFDERLPELTEKADLVCCGRFSFLGIDFQADDPIRWQQDPETKRSWPSRFYVDVKIPFCDGTGSRDAVGDTKHVWELNRHEFLIDCAKTFYLTGQNQYAQRVFDVISSWVQGNPYLQGVNWAGPLEVAVRALAWLWAYQFCRTWQDLPSDSHFQWIQSFYQHGAYLRRHLEFYTSPNNHLVGEATALYLLGCFFPEFDESPDWQCLAWDVLAAEPERQFFEDGGTTEQATFYHHYCLGFFLLAVLTRQRRGEPVPRTMLDRLETALNFGLWMTTPDGTVPRIGDCDDARSIRFGATPHWDFRNLLSLGAVMFGRADMKAVAGSLSEDSLWLLGAEGYSAYQQLSSKAPSNTSQVFPASGYAIMRSGWGPEDDHLCFDCGPIGDGLSTKDIPLFTHGHADLLSFTLSAFGKPLLVDSGFYTYNGSPDWHRYCRDVPGHNTIRVDGVSQAKFNTANAWSCVAVPDPILWQPGAESELAEGTHSGFFGVSGRVRHRRAVYWNRRSHWQITDWLEGEGEHLVETFFHFAPGQAHVLPEGDGVEIETDDRVHAVLKLLDVNQLTTELNIGGARPDEGWIATSYGCRKPAPLVRFHGRIRLPVSLTYILVASQNRLEDLILERLFIADEDGQPTAKTVRPLFNFVGLAELREFDWEDTD
jgi:hypothetical protein